MTVKPVRLSMYSTELIKDFLALSGKTDATPAKPSPIMKTGANA
jgi:hypothetical protein